MMVRGSSPLGAAMRVFVYKNLHKGCYSVRDEATKRVILHTNRVLVKNAKLVVQQGGRQKVLNERRKNVHAGIRGELVDNAKSKLGELEWTPVTYNPYKHKSFVYRSNGQPVHEAVLVLLNDEGAHVLE